VPPENAPAAKKPAPARPASGLKKEPISATVKPIFVGPTTGSVLERKSIPMSTLVGAGVITFALTLGIGLYFVFREPPITSVQIEKLTADAAQKTVDEVGGLAPADRTYQQSIELGNAYARMDLVKDALDAYEYAAKIGEIPAGSSPLSYTLSKLGDPLLSDTAIRVLQSFRGSHIDAALAKALEHELLIVRRNALRAMQRRGSATVVQQVDVAIRDLLTAPTCEERRLALAELAKNASGSDVKRTLEAIALIEQRPGAALHSCMNAELAPAKQRIIER